MLIYNYSFRIYLKLFIILIISFILYIMNEIYDIYTHTYIYICVCVFVFVYVSYNIDAS